VALLLKVTAIKVFGENATELTRVVKKPYSTCLSNLYLKINIFQTQISYCSFNFLNTDLAQLLDNSLIRLKAKW
jgi:hypothetical protein